MQQPPVWGLGGGKLAYEEVMVGGAIQPSAADPDTPTAPRYPEQHPQPPRAGLAAVQAGKGEGAWWAAAPRHGRRRFGG